MNTNLQQKIQMPRIQLLRAQGWFKSQHEIRRFTWKFCHLTAPSSNMYMKSYSTTVQTSNTIDTDVDVPSYFENQLSKQDSMESQVKDANKIGSKMGWQILSNDNDGSFSVVTTKPFSKGDLIIETKILSVAPCRDKHSVQVDWD